MSTLVDELAPAYVGEDRLGLTLSSRTANPAALAPVEVEIDYSRALPEGVMLPLEFTVTGPSPESFRRVIYRRHPPRALSFTPVEGGAHLVRLVECFHNRWLGKLLVDVTGERLGA